MTPIIYDLETNRFCLTELKVKPLPKRRKIIILLHIVTTQLYFEEAKLIFNT